MRNKKHFFWLPILCLFTYCANPVLPSGGERDVTAPKVLASQPKNNNINFSDNKISIRFDEFVQLKNTNKNIVISPLVKKRPNFRLRGKNLIIQFKEPLDTNTTYTINFGESIVDLTEGNELEDFVYAFSTGNQIDSLQIKGQTIDAQSLKKIGKVLLGLYPSMPDSLFLTQAPRYIAQSDKNGKFQFNNLAAGTYRLTALIDENRNYYYDQVSEQIGFYPEYINLTDSIKASFTLHLFQEESTDTITRVLEKKQDGYGKLNVILSKPQANIQLTSLSTNLPDSTLRIQTNNTNDSITIWYHNDSLKRAHFALQADQMYADTIRFRNLVDTTKLAKLTHSTNVSTKGKLGLDQKLRLQFSHPIAEWLRDSIVIWQDSTKQLSELNQFVRLDSQDLRKIVVDFTDWEVDKTYRLLVSDSTIRDFFGRFNTPIKLSFQPATAEDYGTLLVKILDYQVDKQYIFELRDKKDRLLRKEIVTDTLLRISQLAPQTYKSRLVLDENKNGKWDTGNFIRKKQPEKIGLPNANITIKANWETEVEISIREKEK